LILILILILDLDLFLLVNFFIRMNQFIQGNLAFFDGCNRILDENKSCFH